MSVHVWLYRSRATRALSSAEVLELLNVARTRNQENGISGMLLYHDGRFTQVVEGDEDRIERLRKNIMADDLHEAVETIFIGKREERVFSSWSMAFHEMTDGERSRFEAFLPLDWARRTLESAEVEGELDRAFSQMADWARAEQAA